jgi:ArsR family transcriptional regulator
MNQKMDLQHASQHFRLLSDSTRLRLLMLVDREELSVAELSAITQLAQPRVSTHLAKLKEAGLVNDRREGVFVYYRMAGNITDKSLNALWELLRANTDDPVIQQDIDRIPQVLSARSGNSSWADKVAGDMERHYSPGRTWEATSRAMVQLLNLGDVLDIASGDGALADEQPQKVFDEACRVLRPGGRLLAVTLQKHAHKSAVNAYNHLNLGFTEAQLRKFCTRAGLEPLSIQMSAIEKRTPNFEILTLMAGKTA